jgi:hypothetical protein
MDNLTKQVILIPCPLTTTSKMTATLFEQYVLRYHGLPRFINCDRGPQFISHFWSQLWKSLGTRVKLSAPYHPQSNSIVERQNKTFQESLRIYVNARQEDWEDCLIFYEFAYNNSVNPSTGQTPFYLNQGRHPNVPVSLGVENPSPAAADFVKDLNNEIDMARDHIKQTQGKTADKNVANFQTIEFKPNDLVLLNTANYNLGLPSDKLAPRWLGPLRILQIRGPNTVLIEVPPRLSRIEPIQNVTWLRKYVSRPDSLGPTPQYLPPQIINDNDEFEVEDILAHRIVNKKTQYLVRFKSYGPEDDLWLPAANLANAPEIINAYKQRQNDDFNSVPAVRETAKRPPPRGRRPDI